MLEMVTPARRAWKRARLAIGTTPPRLRSMRPSSSTCSRPRKPERRLEVGRGAGQPAQEVGVRRRLALDLDQRADDLQAADQTWRKSNATAAARTRWERSGCSRQSWNTRRQSGIRHAPARLRASTSALSAPNPHRARPRSRPPRARRSTSRRRRSVGVGEGVVLVGGQRRLPAGGRSERHPRPGRRRRAALGRGRGRSAGSLRCPTAAPARGRRRWRDAGTDERDDHLRQVATPPRPPRRRVAAWAIDRRRANGVRLSRYIRSVAVTTPSGVPSASTTGRWWMPGVEHVDHRVDRQPLGRERVRGRHHQLADRRVVGAVCGRPASGAGRSR